MKYCVYFYYIKDELVYVGKSINVYNRYLQHCYEREEFKLVDRVGVMECDTKTDMDLLEVYYITLFKPRMNGTHTDRDKSTFKVKHNEIVYYNMEDFKEKYGGCEENIRFTTEIIKEIPFIEDRVSIGRILDLIEKDIYCFQDKESVYKIYFHNSGDNGFDLKSINSNREKNMYVKNNTVFGKCITYVLNYIHINNIKINNDFNLVFRMDIIKYKKLFEELSKTVIYKNKELKTNGIIFIEEFNKNDLIHYCYPLYEIRYNFKKEQIELVKIRNV